MHPSISRRLFRYVLLTLSATVCLPVAGATPGAASQANSAPVAVVSTGQPVSQKRTEGTELGFRPVLPVLVAEMNPSIFPTTLSVDVGGFPSTPRKASEDDAQKLPPGQSDLGASASWTGVLSTLMLVVFFLFRRTS